MKGPFVNVTGGAPDHALFVRYLLGELPQEERLQFEQACLDDDLLFEQLEAVEAELTDDYIRGELRGPRRAEFEKRLLHAPGKASEIELSKLLTGASKAPRRPAPMALRILAVAAALLLAAVSGWFWINRAKPQPVETAALQSKESIPVPTPATPPPSEPAAAPDRAARIPTPSKSADAVSRIAPHKTVPTSASPQAAPPMVSEGGAISGVIVDPSGAAVAGARVVAHDLITGADSTTQSNTAGEYSFQNLPPGQYQILAQAAGFSQAEARDLPLTNQETLTANLALQVGQATQTVVVTATANEQIQVSNAQLSSSVNAKNLEILPSPRGQGVMSDKIARAAPAPPPPPAAPLAPDADTDGNGLTNAVELALGTNPRKPDGLQVFSAYAAAPQPGRFAILSVIADPTSVKIRFSEPIATGVTLADARAAITKALAGKSINGSLPIAYSTLQTYLNHTCCGNSMTGQTVSVVDPDAVVLAGTLAVSIDGLSVTFTPSKPFAPHTRYTVIINGVKDRVGNTMSEFKSSFSTSP